MFASISPDKIDVIEETENGRVLIGLSEKIALSTILITLDYPFFKEFIEKAEVLLKAMMIAKGEK